MKIQNELKYALFWAQLDAGRKLIKNKFWGQRSIGVKLIKNSICSWYLHNACLKMHHTGRCGQQTIIITEIITFLAIRKVNKQQKSVTRKLGFVASLLQLGKFYE